VTEFTQQAGLLAYGSPYSPSLPSPRGDQWPSSAFVPDHSDGFAADSHGTSLLSASAEPAV